MGAYDSSKRIFYYDALRVIAIFLVILCHVSTEFCKHGQIGTLDGTVPHYTWTLEH